MYDMYLYMEIFTIEQLNVMYHNIWKNKAAQIYIYIFNRSKQITSLRVFLKQGSCYHILPVSSDNNVKAILNQPTKTTLFVLCNKDGYTTHLAG